MKKIKKGDEVIIIAGKDKKRRGTVLSVLTNDKVVVGDINTVKKHIKANPNAGEQGGIVIKAMPIHISNVMLYNPDKEVGNRIGIRVLADGRKVRYHKSTNEVVDADV